MKRVLPVLLVLFLLMSAFPHSVHADVAPPETVPGSNLNPGEGSTQVRMVAETVTLTVLQDPRNAQGAVAQTEAVFTMRNLGTQAEALAVRFPLSFFNGASDGFFNYPELPSIAVKVDGKSVSTRQEIQPFLATELGRSSERDEIPWAVFDVTFPPNQDVMIEVTYDVEGFGYYPYEVFKYVLETGAGWNGTIGSADVILRLPYEASDKNVWVEGVEGYGPATQGGVFSGNEVRWHYDDLEPNSESNMQFVIVTPSLWKNVLVETDNVTRNPNDGEAWGRLGKAYKEIVRFSKGWLRTDSAGQEMFELSKQAYEQSLAILPDDSLWHYGYADLLWSRYYWDFYMISQPDVEGYLPATLSHLKTALEFDPNNELAYNLLMEIIFSMDGAVAVKEGYAVDESGRYEPDNFDYLALTATPLPPTPYGGFPTETALPPTAGFVMPTQVPSTPTINSATTEPPPPIDTNPLCGSAFLLPALLGMVWVGTRRK